MVDWLKDKTRLVRSLSNDRLQFLRFIQEFRTFKQLSAQYPPRLRIKWTDRYPWLYDKTALTPFNNHYVYHPAWAARILSATQPPYHVDISSILSFCTIVSAFIPVRFYDYRPANLKLGNLSAEHADLTQLPFDDNSISSLSCMHTVEHIGLGRYGDPLDPEGDLKAIAELKRVTSTGGNLLFATPVGKPRVQFNAHRVYSYRQIIGYFEGFRLEGFALIPDSAEKGIVYNAPEAMADAQRYGCGCFHFVKTA